MRSAVASSSYASCVPCHAANEEVEQENLFGVGGPIQQRQFFVRVGDDLLLMVFWVLLFFLSSLVNAEHPSRKLATRPTLLFIRPSGVPVLPFSVRAVCEAIQ